METPDGGKVIIRGRRWQRKDVLLEESSVKLYVHPRTGILLRNRRYASFDARKKKERQAQHERQLAVRREIGEHEQLHCIEGIWYQVMLGVLPKPKVQARQIDGQWEKKTIHEACWDVVRKEWVSREHGVVRTAKHHPSNLEMYGEPNKYAASKRQLNSQELKKHECQAYAYI